MNLKTKKVRFHKFCPLPVRQPKHNQAQRTSIIRGFSDRELHTTHTHMLSRTPPAIIWSSQSRRTATCAVSCRNAGKYRPKVIAAAARADCRVQLLDRACSFDNACSSLRADWESLNCTALQHHLIRSLYSPSAPHTQTIVVTALDPGLEPAIQQTLPGPLSVCTLTQSTQVMLLFISRKGAVFVRCTSRRR